VTLPSKEKPPSKAKMPGTETLAGTEKMRSRAKPRRKEKPHGKDRAHGGDRSHGNDRSHGKDAARSKPRPQEVAPAQVRRHAREIVLKTLYQTELAGLDAAEAEAVVRRKLRRPAERDFAVVLLKQTLENLEGLDRMIASVAENWDLHRMAVVDRNILRLGAAEILYVKTPAGVAINEAIEIAKRFSTEDSGRFVNGILDKVARLSGEIRDNL